MPEQAAYDVTFYDLRIRLNPADSSIAGSLDAYARIEETISDFVLDLDPRLTVYSVHLTSGAAVHAALEFERRGGKLWIHLPEEALPGALTGVQVRYGGKPRPAPNAPWSGGLSWSRTPALQPWIATTCQQEGPDIWWPSKDHPSDKPDSMALHVTVPDPLVVATNGRLVDRESNDDGTTTYHWFVSTPVSSYNVALNIAPYRTVEETYTSVTGETFPIIFWTLPENHERGRLLMPEIIEHMRFFEDVAGPYPFRADKYGVVETPHLGMEHQTIIAYGARFRNGAMTGGVDWGFDALHHHELSHEWFGNLMTNADWSDMWLHEGFGSYMQPLYLERTQGEHVARAYMASILPNISNRSPVAPRESQTAKQIYGGDIYFKGAWVLHTLRYLLGDDPFFRIIRRLAYPDPAMERVRDGSHTHFATTDWFIALAEEESGTDLEWFFEVYLRQPQLPRLVTQRTADELELRWTVPPGLKFTLPVDVELNGETVRVAMDGGQGLVTLAAGVEPVVDPLGWILMEQDRR
jgi:aminopeptidase N